MGTHIMLSSAFDPIRLKLGPSNVRCTDTLSVSRTMATTITEAVATLTSEPVAPLRSQITVVCPKYGDFEVMVDIQPAAARNHSRAEKVLGPVRELLQKVDLILLSGPHKQGYLYLIRNRPLA